ncbi:TPA: Hin recombinase [Enterobacter kobei]|nr:Hin recombinase [Enterobacter kobei]HCU0609743.1 Hin recombinase [Enterobacter kobei]
MNVRYSLIAARHAYSKNRLNVGYVPFSKRPPSTFNEEQQRAVIDRLNAGTTISAVAREFNTSRQTIIRVRAGNQKRNAVLPDY